jgi:tRNA1(Val) A37 N6-methylase TrmN6
MALIFQRLARNFIKNGYFPTDEATLAGILSALDIGGATLRILDPCCGEGTALAEVKHHLTECGAAVEALGVEFDAERAWHAKGLLDTVAHSDVADVLVTARSVGLLFLNPPYGHTVADRAGTSERARGDRLEKLFCRRVFPWLKLGGVLALIVPHYVLDAEFAELIARGFTRARVFMAPEQRFRQCVILGIRRRSDRPDPKVAARLEAVGRGELPDTLPEAWAEEPYLVPGVSEGAEFALRALRLDADQLGAELGRLAGHTLWPRFPALFSTAQTPNRPPLRAMSRWHLALALAAGQIGGVIRSKTGRTLLIKGDTFKEKETHVEYEERPDGTVAETRILTDRFVPVIRAIDLTPGPGYGDIVTIS